jgi:hypothetical protein
MAYLSALSPAAKCYCAWFPKGECHSCPPHLSVADRIPLECPACHNYPPAKNLSRTITHNIKCTTPDWQPSVAVTQVNEARHEA